MQHVLYGAARQAWVHPGIRYLSQVALYGTGTEAAVARMLVTVAVQSAALRSTTGMHDRHRNRRTAWVPKVYSPTLPPGHAEAALRLVGRCWGLYVLAGDRLLCSNGASIGLGLRSRVEHA